MMYNSKVGEFTKLPVFPEFTSEKVYMRPIHLREPWPGDLDRWYPVLSYMLSRLKTEHGVSLVYLMIDQAYVKAGKFHRRSGVHIDGYWHPELSTHSATGGHSSRSWVGEHSYHGQTPPEPAKKRKKRPSIPTDPVHDKLRDIFIKKTSSTPSGWGTADFAEPEGIILATNIEESCAAYEGVYQGPIGDGGDCAHIKLPSAPIILEPNVAYAGNVVMLHETLRLKRDAHRTVIRLNVPGWTP